MSNFYMEGNNGGDRISIKKLADGRVHLKVGHCCVYYIDKIVPIEWLSLVLAEASLEGIAQHVERSNWPTEYKTELLSKFGDDEESWQ